MAIYHSENQRILKSFKAMKSKLHAICQLSRKSICTRNLCVEWVHKTFGPRVKEYIKEKHLPLRCLLVMESATAHPQDLDGDFPVGSDYIKVKLLPPNTTPLLQPIDQQVISNFGKLHTRALF